jgi:hypothetical protein
MSKVTIKGNPPISKLAHSPELSAILHDAAVPVYLAVKADPNPEYTKTIRFYEHNSHGRRGRVSWRIGVAPQIGLRVEAVRGTLRRALGLIK